MFSSWQHYLRFIFNSLFFIFCFCLPLSQSFSIKLIVGLSLLSFFLKKEEDFFKIFIQRSWDNLLYLLILALGLLYTSNIWLGLNTIETQLSLLAVPLICSSLQHISTEKIYRALVAFSLGLITACITCLVGSVIAYLQNGHLSNFFFYQFTSHIDFQPTYFAYYLIFGITCAVYVLYNSLLRIPLFVLVLVSFFFYVSLLLTGGWTANIALFFVFSFFIFKYFTSSKNIVQSVTMILIVIMMSGFFLFDFATKEYDDIEFKNDYWERSILWDAAFKATPSLLLGSGTGDVNEVLNCYYLDHQMDDYEKMNYNAHNQFIHSYASNGILGFIALIILLGRPLYFSARYRFPFITLAIFPFLLYGVMESFLGRYQGVVFFAFIQQIFLSYFYASFPYKKKRRKSVDDLPFESAKNHHIL